LAGKRRGLVGFSASIFVESEAQAERETRVTLRVRRLLALPSALAVGSGNFSIIKMHEKWQMAAL
jgi:hypothetical protein